MCTGSNWFFVQRKLGPRDVDWRPRWRILGRDSRRGRDSQCCESNVCAFSTVETMKLIDWWKGGGGTLEASAADSITFVLDFRRNKSSISDDYE